MSLNSDLLANEEVTENFDKKQLHLPTIQRPLTNKSLRELEKQTYYKLPNLRTHEPSRTKKIRQECLDDLNQVDKRLKLIMQEQKMVHIEQSSDSHASSAENNFAEKINKNMQIIKEHKQKNSGDSIEKNQPNRNKLQPYKHVQAIRNMNGAIIDKHTKNYLNLSSESNHIDRKKKSRNNKSKKNQMKNIREEIIRQKQISNEKVNANSIIIKNRVIKDMKSINSQRKERNTQESHLKRNQQLFSKIQGYLEDPKQHHSFQNQNVLSNCHKKKLESKIQRIENKLGLFANREQIKMQLNSVNNTTVDKIIQHCSSQWRKVQINRKKMLVTETTFDNEMQRINQYLQRNQMKLKKYIQNQKIIMDLNYTKQINHQGRQTEKSQ